MKNKLFNLLLWGVIVAGLASCDSPESYVVHKGTFRSVFERKKNKIIPVLFTDSFVVKNINDVVMNDGKGLEEGDRAYMDVTYVYEPLAMPAPDMEIVNVYAEVPLQKLSSRQEVADVDFKYLYNSPIKKIETVWLQSMTVGDARYAWADDKTQNIVVNYNKNDYGSFKLALDSVSYSGGTLYFRLYSHLEPANGRIDPYAFPSEANPTEKVCRILSFEVDWEKLKNELTADELSRLTTYEQISSAIAIVGEECEKVNGLYVPKEKVRTNFFFKNPWYMNKDE